MAQKLRAGFIGAGGIARGGHLPGFKAQAEHCEVVAATDVNPASREAFAAATGLSDEHLYEDYQSMLARENLDLAVICTPNSYHYQPTLDAFAAGCHVLCEKPVAINADQARAMTEAGHQANRLFMVGQSTRFTRPALMMKQWVDQGDVGDIYWARAQYLRVRGIPARLGFVTKELSQGGPIYDIGVHVLDLALWLMGFPEPVSVSAGVYNRLASRQSPLMPFTPQQYTVPEDAALSFIRFANGATISLECSWALNLPTAAMNVTVCGDQGGCEYDPVVLVTERQGILERVTPEVFPQPELAGHTEEIRQFVEAIINNKPSPVPGEEALVTQRILDAIYESGEQGGEVAVK